MADGNVDATHLLVGIATLPVFALVNDRVQAHCGLASLAVTNDQLPLPASDCGHGIHCFDTGLQWLFYRLPLDHAGSLHLKGSTALGNDFTETINRGAQRIDDSTHEVVTDRHTQYFAGTPDLLTFFDFIAVSQENRANLSNVQVQRETFEASFELQQFVGHRRMQAFDVGDAITGVEYSTHFISRVPCF